MTKDADTLGPSDITIAGLQIWIGGRQFPNATDYWDGNWLDVIACCEDKGSEVWAGGPIIHLSEIAQWLSECEQLYQTLQGEAQLACMEPNLYVRLTGNGYGQIKMQVNITPDNLTQKHEFIFSIDQSYLPTLIEHCRRVIGENPLRPEKQNLPEKPHTASMDQSPTSLMRTIFGWVSRKLQVNK